MNVEQVPNDQFVTYGENFANLTRIKSQIKLSGSQNSILQHKASKLRNVSDHM